MPSPQEILFRIFLAFILSGSIGIERETRNHTAGLRTHILVCIGSALVMLVSLHLFELYKGQTNLDPARLGAQVISGIGFLGAGTILKEGASIRGLTTAAGLWAVACIGLAAGSGFYIGAITVTVTVILTLTLIDRFEERVVKGKSNYFITLRIENKPGQLGKICSALGEKGISIKYIKIFEIDDCNVEASLTLRLPERITKKEVFQIMSNVDGVKQIVNVS